MTARFQGPLVDPETGCVKLSIQSSRPADAVDYRGMIVSPDGVVYGASDIGQPRVFQDGIAIDAATGLTLIGSGPVVNIAMGGLGVNAAGAVVSNSPPDVIHQGVGITNLSELCAGGVLTPDFIAFGSDNGQLRALVKGEGEVNFSRETAATVTDFEGIIKTARPHELRFYRARRIRNIIEVAKEWNAFGGAVLTVTGQDSFSLSGLTGAGTGALNSKGDYDGVSIDGRQFRCRMEVKGEGADIGKNVTILIKRNSGGTPTLVERTVTLTGDWVKYDTGGVLTGVTDNIGIQINVIGAATNPAAACLFQRPMTEEVTGQSNQNPSEYVPVGVGDGVEISTDPGFDNPSDWTAGTGWQVTGGQAVATAVTGGNDLIANSTLRPIQPNRTYSAVYKVSDYVAGGVRVNIGGTLGESKLGESTVYDALVTGTTTSPRLQRTIGDFTGKVDDLHVELCDHGAYIDGVAYFAYENGTTVDGNGVITDGRGAPIDGWFALMESNSTNYALWSEDFSNAVWTKTQCVADANATMSPDGRVVAYRQNVTPGTDVQPEFSQGVGNIASEQNSYSAYFKDDGAGYAWVSLWGSNTFYYTAVVDLSTGQVTDSSASNATSTSNFVQNVGKGWYRLRVRANISAQANALVRVGAVNTSTPTFVNGIPQWSPVDGQDVFVTMVQCERSKACSSTYIRTEATTVSRSRDVGDAMFDIANTEFTQGTIIADAVFVVTGQATRNMIMNTVAGTGGQLYERSNYAETSDVGGASNLDGVMDLTVNPYNIKRFAVYYSTGSTMNIGGRDVTASGPWGWDATPANYTSYNFSSNAINVASLTPVGMWLRNLEIYKTELSRSDIEAAR